jgi:hypothetical protein
VHVDAAHRGLGTALCGPDTLPEYLLALGKYRWSYTLVTPTACRGPVSARLPLHCSRQADLALSVWSPRAHVSGRSRPSACVRGLCWHGHHSGWPSACRWASAARLRGAETVIVGIQPTVAFAMVRLGMGLDNVHTALDLEEGLEFLAAAAWE